MSKTLCQRKHNEEKNLTAKDGIDNAGAGRAAKGAILFSAPNKKKARLPCLFFVFSARFSCVALPYFLAFYF